MASSEHTLRTEVQEQCDKICSASILARSEQRKAVLRFLVGQFPQRASSKDIAKALLSQSLLSPHALAEDQNLAVRQAVRQLRKELEKYYQEHPTDSLIVKIPITKSGIGYGLIVETRTVIGSASVFAPSDVLTTLVDFPKSPNHLLQLLNPRFRDNPFVGREVELESLWEWLNQEVPASFKIMVGHGGLGKTRIAYRFLELVEERRPGQWYAGVLPEQRCAEALKSDSLRRWRGHRDTLVIIDDASVWAEALAKEVIPEIRDAKPGGVRLRVLLVDRGADANLGWYQTLLDAANLDAPALFPCEPLCLAELGLDDRNALFAKALGVVSKFTSESRVDVDPAIAAQYLKMPEMGDPLMILIAAMRVHERRDLAVPSWKPEDAVNAISRHERHRVRSLADPTVSMRMLLHMMAYVTLTGPLTREELLEACEEESANIELHSKKSSLDLADLIEAKALPSDDAAFAASPVEPRIVGVSFIKGALSAPHEDPAGTILRALRRKPFRVARLLTDLKNEWVVWALDEAVQYPETSCVRRLRAEARRDRSLLPELAYNLWVRSMLLKERRQELEAAKLREEAWELYQSLGETDDLGLYFAGFAGLLTFRASTAWQSGQNQQALDLILQALALLRRAESKYEMAPRRGSFKSNHEAPEYFRQHRGKLDMETFNRDFARCLNLQSRVQHALGQRREALESNALAIERFRALLEEPSWEAMEWMARALDWHVAILSELGDFPGCRKASGEATYFYFELSRAFPRVYLVEFYRTHGNWIWLGDKMGDSTGAADLEQQWQTQLRNIRVKLPIPGRTESHPKFALHNDGEWQEWIGEESPKLNITDEADGTEYKVFHTPEFGSILALTMRPSYSGIDRDDSRSWSPPSPGSGPTRLGDVVPWFEVWARQSFAVGAPMEPAVRMVHAILLDAGCSEWDRWLFGPASAAWQKGGAKTWHAAGNLDGACYWAQSAAQNSVLLLRLGRTEEGSGSLSKTHPLWKTRDADLRRDLDELLPIISDCLEQRRNLALADRPSHLWGLTHTLLLAADIEAELGRSAEMMCYVHEAVPYWNELYLRERRFCYWDGQRLLATLREAVSKERKAFLPDLASCLLIAARVNHETRERDRGFNVVFEAVQHYVELAQMDRETYLPEIAQAISLLDEMVAVYQATDADELDSLSRRVQLLHWRFVLATLRDEDVTSAECEAIGNSCRDLVSAGRQEFLPLLSWYLLLAGIGWLEVSPPENGLAVARFSESLMIWSRRAELGVFASDKAFGAVEHQIRQLDWQRAYLDAAAAAEIQLDAELCEILKSLPEEQARL